MAVLKMIDFYLSEVVPTLLPPANNVFGLPTSTSHTGSRSYAAPEVIAGAHQGIQHDMFLADVWSLGVVLFAMVAGFFFVDTAADYDPRFVIARQAQQAGLSTVAAIFAMHKRPNPLSAPLVALLDGMLTINPAQRITLDQIVASPLGTCGPVPTVGPARASWAQGCTHRSGAAQLVPHLTAATISAASHLPKTASLPPHRLVARDRARATHSARRSGAARARAAEATRATRPAPLSLRRFRHGRSDRPP
jgi:serine/threonine protein kinase